MTVNKMIEEIKKINDKASKKDKEKYNFQLTERILARLDSFPECSECKTFIKEYAVIIDEAMKDASIVPNKNYISLQKKALIHLQKNHKLVTEGYYTGYYMAIGCSVGLMLGVVLSQAINNIAFLGIGLPIGIAFGLPLGSKLDAKAKEEGLMI